MATLQSFIAPICDTVANFKAIGQAVENFLTTAGFSRTADTGQVNWASVASVPTVVGTFFIMQPPADGFTPYYVRFDFFASGTDPRLRLIIGTATNGSGTITGTTYTPTTIGNNTGSSTTLAECNCSYATGRFGLMMFRNAASSGVPYYFSLERARNATGGVAGSHTTFIVAAASTTAGFTSQVSFLSSGVRSQNSSPIVLGDSLFSSSGVISGQIPISPVFPSVGFFDYPLTGTASARGGDFGEGVTVTTSLYGAPATYLASKTGQGFAIFGAGNATNSCLLMRWE